MNINRKLFRVLHRISVLVAGDETLWAELGTLIREFGVTADDPASKTTESETDLQSSPSASMAPDVEDKHSCSTAIDSEQVVSSPVKPAVAPELTQSKRPPDEDQRCVSHDLVGRCQLKSDGCRWVLERMRLKEIGANHLAEIAPGDRAILEKSKQLPDCHLWMNRPSAPMPEDLSHYAALAGCFEALAAVLKIAANSQEDLADNNALFEQLLRLVAEAQSAVREAVRRVGGSTDQDQVDAFWWVRLNAAETGIYIERYMREEDPAEPDCWKELLNRINGFAERIENRATAERKRRKLFHKLRYQFEQATSGEETHLWETVARTLHDLVQDGLPPSNVEVRDLLLPHIDIIPQFENPPQSFELVLREIKRFQELMGEEPIDDEITEICPQVESAAEMIHGRAVVLIGGDPRSDPKDALERAFHLSELVWVPTKHGQSVSTFESSVSRSEVAVVLLAIRWASHSFTDVRHICRKYDKPLVRLPGGYSPNQVAIQMLNQCSWRLTQGR